MDDANSRRPRLLMGGSSTVNPHRYRAVAYARLRLVSKKPSVKRSAESLTASSEVVLCAA